MNAKQLFTNDGPLQMWVCWKCACYNTVHYSLELAEKCCTCETCGATTGITGSFHQCSKCSNDRIKKEEQERFEKARKIPVKDYDGMILDNESVIDPEEYIEWMNDQDEVCPEWVWATTSEPVLDKRYFDVDEIIELATQDNCYDGFDPSDLDGIEELHATLKKFYDLNDHILVYHEDHTRAVILKEPVYES